MSSKCGAYVLQGEVCRQCGQEHKPLIPSWVILCGLTLLAAGIFLYFYYRRNGEIPHMSSMHLEPGLSDYTHEGWTIHGGTLYAPGDGPR